MTGGKLLDLWAEITAKTSGFELGISKVRQLAKHAKEDMDAAARSAKAMFLVVSAAAGFSVMEYAKFEQKMQNVKAVLEESDDVMAALAGEARRLGQESVFSATQAAGAMEEFAKQGFNANEIIKIMPKVMSMAAAGQMELNEAALIAAGIMRSANEDVSQINRVMDVLVRVAAEASGEVRNFGEAMAIALPVASESGAKIEDIAAAAGILKNRFLEDSVVGTALRNLFTRLRSPVEGSQKALAALGIQVRDNTGQMRPFLEILMDIKAAASQVSPEFADMQLQAIAGTRAINALYILLDSVSGEFQYMRGAMDQAGGSADKMAKTQLDSLIGKFTILWRQVQEAAIKFGELLAPALEQIMAIVTAGLQTFNGLSDAFKELIIQFGLGIAISSSLVIGISGLMTVFSLLVNPLAVVATVLASVVSWFILAQAEGATLTEKLNSLREKGVELYDALKDKVIEWFKATLYAFAFVKTAIVEWKTVFRLVFAEVSLAFVTFVNDFAFFFTDQLPNWLGWLARNWHLVFFDMLDIAEKVLTNLAKNFENLIEEIAWQIASGFTADWTFVWTGLLQGFQSNLQEMPRILAREQTALEQTMTAGVEELRQKLADGTIQTYDDLIKKFNELIETSKKKAEELQLPERKKKHVAAVQSALPGIVQEVKFAFTGVDQFIQDIQKAVGGDEKNALAKQQLLATQESNDYLSSINTQVSKIGSKSPIGKG